jgi:hypothetical protein
MFYSALKTLAVTSIIAAASTDVITVLTIADSPADIVEIG